MFEMSLNLNIDMINGSLNNIGNICATFHAGLMEIINDHNLKIQLSTSYYKNLYSDQNVNTLDIENKLIKLKKDVIDKHSEDKFDLNISVKWVSSAPVTNI